MRRRPLAGAARLVRLLAAVDQAAIDETGDDRRQLARERRDHGLVQLAEALLHPLLPDQIGALLHQGDREQIRIAETRGDLGRRGGGGAGGLQIARRPVLEIGCEQQIALLDTVAPLFEQPLGAREPARGARDLPAEHEVHADPEGAADSRQILSAIEVALMRTLQRAQLLLVAAQHVRDGREQLQVPRCERRLPIGTPQRLVGLYPRTLGVRAPAACELIALHAGIVPVPASSPAGLGLADAQHDVVDPDLLGVDELVAVGHRPLPQAGSANRSPRGPRPVPSRGRRRAGPPRRRHDRRPHLRRSPRLRPALGRPRRSRPRPAPGSAAAG